MESLLIDSSYTKGRGLGRRPARQGDEGNPNPPERNPIFRKEIQAGGNKFQIRRNEIQTQILHLPSPNRAFSMAHADPHCIFFFYANSDLGAPLQSRRCVFAPACPSVFVSGPSGLFKQVKGWRRFDRGWRPCKTRRRRFRPTCRPRSLMAREGNPGSTEHPRVMSREAGPRGKRQADRSDVRLQRARTGFELLQRTGASPSCLRVSHDPSP